MSEPAEAEHDGRPAGAADAAVALGASAGGRRHVHMARTGAVDHVLPLDQIGPAVVDFVRPVPP